MTALATKLRRLRRGLLHENRQRGKAQTTVEFALILWPFFILMFATCDYAQVYFYENSLRHSLREAGRFATPGKIMVTNYYDSNGTATNSIAYKSTYITSNNISRMESIRDWFQTNCVLTVSKSSITITSWPTPPDYTNTEANAVKGPGYANDFVKISVYYPIQLVTPVAAMLWSNGVYQLTVSSIFLNEPSTNFVTYTNYYTAEP